MFMVLPSWLSHFESSPGSFHEYGMAPSGLSPGQTTPAVSPPVGCQKPHPPLPFIIITQPESWCSFYHPMEGRRLRRPSTAIRVCSPCQRLCIVLVFTKNLQLPMVGFKPSAAVHREGSLRAKSSEEVFLFFLPEVFSIALFWVLNIKYKSLACGNGWFALQSLLHVLLVTWQCLVTSLHYSTIGKIKQQLKNVKKCDSWFRTE